MGDMVSCCCGVWCCASLLGKRELEALAFLLKDKGGGGGYGMAVCWKGILFAVVGLVCRVTCVEYVCDLMRYVN